MKFNLTGFGALQLVMLIGWFVTGCKLSLWVVFIPTLIALWLLIAAVVVFLLCLILAAS